MVLRPLVQVVLHSKHVHGLFQIDDCAFRHTTLAVRFYQYGFGSVDIAVVPISFARTIGNWYRKQKNSRINCKEEIWWQLKLNVPKQPLIARQSEAGGHEEEETSHALEGQEPEWSLNNREIQYLIVQERQIREDCALCTTFISLK